MCGIVAALGCGPRRSEIVAASAKLRHRGPDCSGVVEVPGATLAHERLSIIDPNSGAQPLVSSRGTVVAVNGEIYNHVQLRAELGLVKNHGSDCVVLGPLLEESKEEDDWGLNRLRGMFAFAAHLECGTLVVARDHVGICPLYYGRDSGGAWWFASELKALLPQCAGSVWPFPPGHLCALRTSETTTTLPLHRWYVTPWGVPGDVDPVPAEVRRTLERAVESHLMSDVPSGVLLSGGLDSSLVAAIASRALRQRFGPEAVVHSFCVGLPGSPDAEAALRVARHLGTEHHAFEFSVQEALDALPDVVRSVETFDVTTVRASTPMWLMARRIRSAGVRMVLSGEGADELLGGYAYFASAPSAEEFWEETRDKMDRLHLYDCLRANKSMAAWGVECRVPFLDRDCAEALARLRPEAKMGTPEKRVLRQAFDDGGVLLPPEVLWRSKCQFGDGVGHAWIDALRKSGDEAETYRRLFEACLPGGEATVPQERSIACSTERAFRWEAAFAACPDPSGRSVAQALGEGP